MYSDPVINPDVRDCEPQDEPRRLAPIERAFSAPGRDPYEDRLWRTQVVEIRDDSGNVVFSQSGVEAPDAWSDNAVRVVANKYFRGSPGSPEREQSVRHIVDRVVTCIRNWAVLDGYLSNEDARVFEAELAAMVLDQAMAWNSPVWFNVGTDAPCQVSACFIQSIEDSMESIMDLAKSEVRLFKNGSGTGTNLSPLRASTEHVRAGGYASGPVSFMRGFDSFAGVTKSGGRTRRSAKIVILDVDHPDVIEFIDCKMLEERKAWKLIELGYSPGMDGEAYRTVAFQNSNNSVRVPDAFMEAVVADGDWYLKPRTGGTPTRRRARDIMERMARAARECGDPGIQFDTTINDWHTVPADGRIYASNPCGEYHHLDDTACNLASLNLMKFRLPSGGFDIERFRRAVRATILSQEIVVDRAVYPTEKIDANSRRFRPLGLGYANAGAYLLSIGVPYDSKEGRAFISAVTSLMTGEAYAVSAEIARWKGAFAGFAANREPMLRVITKHRDATLGVQRTGFARDVIDAAVSAWDTALAIGSVHGFRNSQVTVIAPTGTIAFMMDCDTTGGEPDFALVKHKRMSGHDGVLKIVNGTVGLALSSLGYSAVERVSILDHMEKTGAIEGAPGLRPEHVPVFDCAVPPAGGVRAISMDGHIRMVAAIQPFVSGSISKTVNAHADTTWEEVAAAYTLAWELGCKCLTVYRDGSKQGQPLSTGVAKKEMAPVPAIAHPVPVRRKLPDEILLKGNKFRVGRYKGRVKVGFYEDGTPGEVWIQLSKGGGTLQGFGNVLAMAISIGLQHGVPLREYTKVMRNVSFEPSGFTGDAQIPKAKSIPDYLARFLDAKYYPGDEPSPSGVAGGGNVEDAPRGWHEGPPCPVCGSITEPNGPNCHRCPNCGDGDACG